MMPTNPEPLLWCVTTGGVFMAIGYNWAVPISILVAVVIYGLAGLAIYLNPGMKDE